ncbi:MAG: 4-alpha-glucanotransferase [Gammaproteobacteria bacterium]|nr:MAG: 4-alpha-glucanotransferase [Gammaproteobacteria bacterium]
MADRRAGVLLHPRALPSGRLDADVERWLELLQRGGFRAWQMLPMNIPDHTGSPYQSCSAFAADPAWLAEDETEDGIEPEALAAYVERERDWLPDFALFRVIRTRLHHKPWTEWPEPLKRREPAALDEVRHTAHAHIQEIIEQQYRIDRRWQLVREEARARDILLFGDLPLFVAHDSADVWAHPHLFLLDKAGNPRFVAGVPPDYFSETGQRWGNPQYDWEAMQAEDFAWWTARMRRQLDWFDLVRLDHFRGLQAVWMIPAEAPTGAEGFWQEVPGAALLERLLQGFHQLPIVAENLGIITPEVEALRTRFGLPGMAVLQFAFDAFEDNPHKPRNIREDTVVYTGTHDNDTTNGWYVHLDEGMKAEVRRQLGVDRIDDAAALLCRVALETRARLAILPLQDILGLGSEARYNTPGTSEGNWQWRMRWESLDEARFLSLREVIRHVGR